MKRTITAIWAIVGAACILSAAAPTDQDYVTWMKAAAAACGRVKKGVDAKTATPEMATDATEMAKNFKMIQGYWKAKKADDGVTLAKEAEAASKMIAKAAKSGDAEAAATHFKAATATCGPCHKAHRDKAGTGWTIK